MNEALSAKQAWKGRSGKTKRGRPTGPREVVEKYRALRQFTLDLHNREQDKVANRLVGSGLCCPWCDSVAERNRLRLKRELKGRAMADAAEVPLEIVEQETREEIIWLAEEERRAEEAEGCEEAAEQGCPLCQELVAQKAKGSCQ